VAHADLRITKRNMDLSPAARDAAIVSSMPTPNCPSFGDGDYAEIAEV
jgi:hypothetical protein